MRRYYKDNSGNNLNFDYSFEFDDGIIAELKDNKSLFRILEEIVESGLTDVQKRKAVFDLVKRAMSPVLCSLGVDDSYHSHILGSVTDTILATKPDPSIGKYTEHVSLNRPQKGPESVQNKWSSRLKGEKAPEFIKRVYKDFLGGEGREPTLVKSSLANLDSALYQALRRWEIKNGPAPLEFAGPSVTTEEEKEAFRRGDKPKNVKDYRRIESAVRREGQLQER